MRIASVLAAKSGVEKGTSNPGAVIPALKLLIQPAAWWVSSSTGGDLLGMVTRFAGAGASRHADRSAQGRDARGTLADDIID
jgi:hypothetical protein